MAGASDGKGRPDNIGPGGSSDDGGAFTSAEHGLWWLVLGFDAGIVILGMLSTGQWAKDTAARAAALFDEVDTGAPA